MMKFTLAWLKEHLDTDAPLAAIVDKLTTVSYTHLTLPTKA